MWVGKAVFLNCRHRRAYRKVHLRRFFLRLHSSGSLFMKEWRELLVSRAYWLMLFMIGLLVGQGFITAINLYAEASGSGGTPAGLGQGLSPLDGILAPH